MYIIYIERERIVYLYLYIYIYYECPVCSETPSCLPGADAAPGPAPMLSSQGLPDLLAGNLSKATEAAFKRAKVSITILVLVLVFILIFFHPPRPQVQAHWGLAQVPST